RFPKERTQWGRPGLAVRLGSEVRSLSTAGFFDEDPNKDTLIVMHLIAMALRRLYALRRRLYALLRRLYALRTTLATGIHRARQHRRREESRVYK
ncbi:hypothetical protein THAOC_18059, partial [Thalassiosira oceanica]